VQMSRIQAVTRSQKSTPQALISYLSVGTKGLLILDYHLHGGRAIAEHLSNMQSGQAIGLE
jgi:hypothetical protein